VILAFHQPNFLPSLGFFHKMAHADLLVIVTNINFERSEGWQRRHKIPGRDRDIWLTVPVRGSQNNLIKDVTISNHGNWQRKHLKTLHFRYARSPEQDLLSAMEHIYRQEWQRLVDLNVALIHLLKETLGITTPIAVDEEVSGIKEQLIINICRKYHAQTYLSGLGGKEYMTHGYYRTLATNDIRCTFVPRDVTGAYPYSALHYIMSQGRAATRSLL
jgi:hypothetical protein